MRRSTHRPSDPATQCIILKIVGFVVERRKFVCQIYLETFRSVQCDGIILRNPGDQTICWEFIHCAAQILVSDSDTWLCVESFFVRSISRLSDEWALDQQCADPHFLSFFFSAPWLPSSLAGVAKFWPKTFMRDRHFKSDNLQYNMLGRWVDGTIVSSTKCLMFQVLFFFIISCKILYKNPFNLFSHFFTKLRK